MQGWALPGWRHAAAGSERHGQFQPGAPEHLRQFLPRRRQHAGLLLSRRSWRRRSAFRTATRLSTMPPSRTTTAAIRAVSRRGTCNDLQWTNVQGETTDSRLRDAGLRPGQRTSGRQRRRARGAHREFRQGFPGLSEPIYAPYLGAGESEPITASNSYTDVLPSLNVRWELADNLIVRFAASKAIARPAFSDMQAYQILNADVEATGVERRTRTTHPDAAGH